jgi:hypothetical protein
MPSLSSSKEWKAVTNLGSMGAKTAGIILLLALMSAPVLAGAVFDEAGRLPRKEPGPAAQPATPPPPAAAPAPAAPAVTKPAPQAPAPAAPAAAAAKQPNIKPQGCVGFYEALCKETPECIWVTTDKNKDGTPVPALCKKKVKAATKPKPKPPAPAPAAAAPAPPAAAPEAPPAAPAAPSPSPALAAPSPADAPIQFPAQ